uniref:Alcohol dehydrogenase-like N-terminal domain-containing protein n=1 Tax=Aegilops tauschii subsp. strangulata TaxID=200361 RepID=A0A453BTV2_AEGTS
PQEPESQPTQPLSISGHASAKHTQTAAPTILTRLLPLRALSSFPRPMATPATTPATMRAVQYDACGGGAVGLKHVEVPVPSAKKNEVLLKLQAATINPVDWKIQKGDMRPLLPRRLPFIPVTDVAGVVVDVGPGVKGLTAGDQVVAMLNSFVSEVHS